MKKEIKTESSEKEEEELAPSNTRDESPIF